jgi:hypothetical protein
MRTGWQTFHRKANPYPAGDDDGKAPAYAVCC